MGTDVKNCNRESPENCISRGFEDTIKLEFKKAQKGKQLLDALSNRDIYRAKILLNQGLNPNCWRRNQNGEIETPLSLIAGLCSEGITENKKEVLTKLLKHKELDFSQIKSIPAIEQNIQLKQIIEQAIKGRLIDTINKKDLDDVKKLIEDNCFMNCAIVIAALGNVNNPTEPIKKYLNGKFPVSVERPLAGMNDIPVGFEELVHKLVDGREKTEAQLAKKEKELSDTRQELNKRNNEIREQQNRISELERELDQAKAQLIEKDRKLNNTRKESRIHRIGKESNGQAISPNRKQNNYALTFFILLGAFVVGTCLTVVDYPEISAGLAVVAPGLFLVGYFLYKGDEKDIGPGSAIDNPQVTRIFYSSSIFC
ncbi:hypothetical protein DM84_01285 [Wolbachia pipientis]|nr:hypothetical protein [Wolbachia pipientis]MCM1001884.1 hypothetical protein [Wolbachia pipientis]